MIKLHLVYILGLDTRTLILGAPFFYINQRLKFLRYIKQNLKSLWYIYFVQIVVNFGAVKVIYFAVHHGVIFCVVNNNLKYQRVKN